MATKRQRDADYPGEQPGEWMGGRCLVELPRQSLSEQIDELYGVYRDETSPGWRWKPDMPGDPPMWKHRLTRRQRRRRRAA